MSGDPGTSVDQAQGATSEPRISAPPKRWFQRRPIAVWIVFVLTSLNMLGVLVAISKSGILDAISAGQVSPSHAILGFLFPLLLFLGGLSLFLMRSVTILFFAAYFLWGVVKVGLSAPYMSYLSLALVAGICIYVMRLGAKGKLR